MILKEQVVDRQLYIGIGTAVLLGFAVAFLSLEMVVMVAGGVVITAVLLLILRQPLWGLALALLAGPFGALENVILGGNVPLDSGQIILFVTIGAWVARGLARRRVVIPRPLLLWPLLALIGVMSLTLIEATSVVLGLIELLKWIEIAVVMVMVIDLVQDLWDDGHDPYLTLYLLIGIIVLAGLSQALIGIWQFAPRGHGPEHFLVLGRFYRAYGTFEQPNPFGGYMGLNGLLALGTSVGLVVWWGERWWQNKKGVWAKISLWDVAGVLFFGVGAAACILALIMSWSRGAWLGFVAASGILAFFLPRKRWQGVLLVVIGLIAVAAAWQIGLIPESITSRVGSVAEEFRLGDVRGVDINDTNYAVIERLAFWQAAVGMVEDNIWLGVGFGNYAAAYPDYALINWTTPLGHAHNYYLNLLAETGILGSLAYLMVWGVIVWQNIQLLGTLSWRGRGVALGLLAAWVALTVHHLVDKLYVNNLYVHLGAMLAVQQLLPRMHDAQRHGREADAER